MTKTTASRSEYGNSALERHISRNNNTAGLKRKYNESTFGFKARAVKAGINLKKERLSSSQPTIGKKRESSNY